MNQPTREYDPSATTLKHYAISKEEAIEIQRAIQMELNTAVEMAQTRAIRRMKERAAIMAVGVLAALGVWKLLDLTIFFLRHQ